MMAKIKHCTFSLFMALFLQLSSKHPILKQKLSKYKPIQGIETLWGKESLKR